MIKLPMPLILRGDARNLPLPDESVDLIVTSPPYFGLRAYTDGGDAYDGQIGAEPTPAEFIAALVECTREMVRVLKPSGSIFVNLGDKYNERGGPGHPVRGDQVVGFRPERPRRRQHPGRPKSLLLLPERYRIACVDELGLIARAVVIWDKPNSMPESVTDRVRRSHEDWVHLTKSPRYFSAVDEIREPPTYDGTRGERAKRMERGMTAGQPRHTTLGTTAGHPLGKLPGSVWEIATQPLRVPAELGIDHFAAFPMEWPRRLILGWSPREVCTACGEGRRPVTAAGEFLPAGHGQRDASAKRRRMPGEGRDPLSRHGETDASSLRTTATRTITGYACACTPYVEHEGDEYGKPWREYHFDTPHPPTTPGVVLDPFSGTGTTALVATMLGRTGIGVDLSADYNRLAEWRASDPKERARASGLDPDAVAAVRPQLPGQESLLDLLDGGAA